MKIAKFSHPGVFNASAEGVGSSWNWVSAQGSEESRMMELPGVRKSFKITLAVLIQYRRVTESLPVSHPATLP